jgi:hypothetical protein
MCPKGKTNRCHVHEVRSGCLQEDVLPDAMTRGDSWRLIKLLLPRRTENSWPRLCISEAYRADCS